MKKTLFLTILTYLTVASLPALSQTSPLQDKLIDALANKVIEKYTNSSCEELAAMKTKKPEGQSAEMEKKAMEILENNPQLAQEFINKVAAPIATKMFQCKLIP